MYATIRCLKRTVSKMIRVTSTMKKKTIVPSRVINCTFFRVVFVRQFYWKYTECSGYVSLFILPWN